MRLLPAWMIVVALMLGLARSARADGPAPALAMDEPKSGLHLEVEGACQVRPEDGGGAACRDFAASAHKSELFAVVLDSKGLLSYSVAIFTEVELGIGEARARRVSKAIGETVTGTPELVTYGEQRFVRTRLSTSNGAALCFITADDRPEVSIIMFASEPESLADMEPKAEAAMRTLRRTAAAAATPEPAGSRTLVTVGLVLVVAVPVLGWIGLRILLISLRQRRRMPHEIEEPRGPPRSGPQLAGEECASCKRNIVIANEAVMCRTCQVPLHRQDCQAKHQAKKHAEKRA